MLTLHFANHPESLSTLLASHLGRGSASLFTPDEVIVPSAAVQRRLTLDVAQRFGICANLQFTWLAPWLWQQVGRLLSAGPLADFNTASPLQPALLTWRVYAALGDAGFVGRHARLAAYVARADGVTRYTLAQRVAALLDQYLTYRPELLADWAAGGNGPGPGAADADAAADAAWQAALWRRLVGELQAEAGSALPASFDPAFVQALPALLADLSDNAAQGAGLPAAAHVFCLPAMPPLYLALLQQLGRWIDLHVYALNPCQEYWFELVDRRRLSRLAAAGRDQHHEEGHRLLAAWGQQAQAQLAALVEVCGDAVIDDAHYQPNPEHTLLGRLQNSILALQDLAPASVPLREGDRSIELHVCHSITRELEVLHDALLALLAAPDAPAPGDILVLLPDLQAAAPLIEAVFGTVPRERALPFTITGRAPSQTQAPARALLDLLALAGSRCAVSAVFGLLQQPVVARRFGLDDEALARVHGWLLQAGVHWALDAPHRASFGLPAVARHSLADGLHRLFLGHALPPQVDAPLAGRLPAGDAEGSAALALGALWQFVQGLAELVAQVAQPLPAAAWPALLRGLMQRFLQPDEAEDPALAELQAAVQALAAQWQASAPHTLLPLDVVRQALQQWLDDPARGGVPTGRITFSAMASLRGLPYRVICLLGLDDGAFPGNARPDEFDLMARLPRRGDRQRRLDERNLFLDLLLAARDRLYLSHSGRSQRDNAALPPSVLVADLLDYLQPALDAPADVARAHLVLQHPLQAFDASLFQAGTDARQRSFNADYAMALAAAAASAPPSPTSELSDLGTAPTATANTNDATDATDSADDPAGDGNDEASDDDASPELDALPFFNRPLPPPAQLLPGQPQQVTLAQLQRFFRHPARYLLRQRLGIQLRGADEALDDDEPFLPGWHTHQALARRLLPALAAGADAATLQALAQAGTELPDGAYGQQCLQQELPLLQAHAAALADLSAPAVLPPHHALLDITLPGAAQPLWQVQAGWADLRPDGLVRHRYAPPAAADYIASWIEHVLLCACAPAGVAGRCTWLGRDQRFAFRPCDTAPEVLTTLLALYAQGQTEPLYFMPKTAWAWLQPGGSLSKAGNAWRASALRPYAEQADAAWQLALRGLPDPLGTEGFARFDAASRAVLQPLLACLEAPESA